MCNALRNSAIAEIVAAFDGVQRGSGISLHEAAVIEDHGSAQERDHARALDTEGRWQDVPDADIEKYNYILSFLDPAGFRYYLPAYMVWSLKNFETSVSQSVDHPIYSLSPYKDDPGLRPWQRERFIAFSPTEAKAILSFLRFMAESSGGCADSDAALAAINDYWNRFSENGS